MSIKSSWKKTKAVSETSDITHQLLKLAEQPGFDYAFQQFERIRYAAELLVELSSTGTASESESESESEKSNKKLTVTTSIRKRKTPAIRTIVEESVEDSDSDSSVEVLSVKKRQVCETPVYWAGNYEDKIYELIKVHKLHVVIPDNISVENILSYDTYTKSPAYAEFKALLISDNLILPIRNSPLYANPGFCSKPLDEQVTALLDKSIQAGVWTRVEILDQKTTTDGKKYYTYTISVPNIKLYKLCKPRA
jgi:hypothetical protein